MFDSLRRNKAQNELVGQPLAEMLGHSEASGAPPWLLQYTNDSAVFAGATAGDLLFSNRWGPFRDAWKRIRVVESSAVLTLMGMTFHLIQGEAFFPRVIEMGLVEPDAPEMAEQHLLTVYAAQLSVRDLWADLQQRYAEVKGGSDFYFRLYRHLGDVALGLGATAKDPGGAIVLSSYCLNKYGQVIQAVSH